MPRLASAPEYSGYASAKRRNSGSARAKSPALRSVTALSNLWLASGGIGGGPAGCAGSAAAVSIVSCLAGATFSTGFSLGEDDEHAVSTASVTIIQQELA